MKSTNSNVAFIAIASLCLFSNIIGKVQCTTERHDVDTISDNWKTLPTHLEFRNWLLNQFRGPIIYAQDVPSRVDNTVFHLLIIEDVGDSSSGSSGSDYYSYEDSSESGSDESSGEESPVYFEEFIPVSDDSNIGNTEIEKDSSREKTDESEGSGDYTSEDSSSSEDESSSAEDEDSSEQDEDSSTEDEDGSTQDEDNSTQDEEREEAEDSTESSESQNNNRDENRDNQDNNDQTVSLDNGDTNSQNVESSEGDVANSNPNDGYQGVVYNKNDNHPFSEENNDIDNMIIPE